MIKISFIPTEGLFWMRRNFQIFVLHNMVTCIETKAKIVSMYIWIRVGRDREIYFERKSCETLSYNLMIHSHHQQTAVFEYCNYMGRHFKVTYSIEKKILLEKLLVVRSGKVLVACCVKR